MNTAAQRRDTADTGSVIYSEEISCSRGAEVPVVLLIHGLAGACGLWNPVSQVLREHFRVIRYDLRGHGESDHFHTAAAYDRDVMAADLAEVVRHASVQTLDVVAFSMGGELVLRYLLRGALLFAHLYADEETAEVDEAMKQARAG